MIRYEVVQSAGMLDNWRVEGIDYDRDGIVYVAVFSGPCAEGRAREYATFKNEAKRWKMRRKIRAR